MFALLAMAGDLGGSIGPWLVGIATQNAGDNLHVGLRFASVFPAVLIAAVLLLGRMSRPEAKSAGK